MSLSSMSYNIQLRFCRALAVVRALPDRGALQPTANEKLNLYGLYKQATEGDCNTPRPSTRQMVQYAKWKSWERRRGLSPIEAQRLYVNTLIELLVEFLNRYPQHEQAPALAESLQYIEMGETGAADDGERSIVDMWDPKEGEKEEYYLGHLGPHQLESHSSFFPEQSPFIRQDYPITPEPSPHQDYRQQHHHNHVSNQKDIRKRSHTIYSPPSARNFVRPMDFLADTSSDADTIDREVAAATASMALTSPSQHPYFAAPMTDNKALESLQTEVAVLAEQLDMLYKTIGEREQRKKRLRWSWKRLFKTVAKHTIINCLLLMLLFLILWRRRSPVAYALIGFVGPQLREITRYLSRRIVFWKITV